MKNCSKIQECFFCRDQLKKNNISKEHKIPIWLQTCLNIKQTPINFELNSHDGERSTKKTYTLTTDVSRVCINCNNGWMSQLEIKTKPIFERLFKNQSDLMQLVVQEKATLNRWLIKTAYVYLSSTEFFSNISKNHISSLKAGIISENVQIFGTKIEASEKIGRSAQFKWQTFPPLKNAADNEKICKESYKVGLHIGNYFFLVTYFPLENWHIALDRRYYILLSDQSSKIVWLTTSQSRLNQINTPREGLEAYVNGAMVISEEIANSALKPTLIDLSGKTWNIF